ncbi:hypothetical protein [Brevundimonas sp. Root1279]|uniref:hypothetical protein n=1 Tax=Brevundimonas sp. Root1279 TaxID=1736443 RepID=UPI000AB79DFB|nr:hypothetical protein [Brevundimonas sp. Root1279]
MTDPQDPAEALAAIQASRKAVHDRVATGGWRYDVIYSVLTAGMVAGQALDAPFNILASTLGLLGLIVIFQAETRRTGLKITGVSPRYARWVAVGIGLAFAAAIVVMAIIRRQSPETPQAVIAGVAAVVIFFVALAGSRIWRRVYRAEMGVGK